MAAAAASNLGLLKVRVRLSPEIGRKVKLTRRGGDWWGCCPFHSEKTASFSVNDAKAFYHCFGCGAHGDILDWWQFAEGLSKAEAIERLKAEAGDAPSWREAELPVKVEDAETRMKREQALAVWQASQPIAGTIAETYLRTARRIRIDLPESLRFHPALPTGGPDSLEWPAMVAAVTNLDGEVIAIQRTFLARDGSGKALIPGPRRNLGALGDGAVRLRPPGVTLGIAEGVETGLSAQEIFLVPVCCALGTKLWRIALPETVQNVAIFADRGEAGELAAEKARQHFHQLGRRVAVRFPAAGKDFNDELKVRRGG